MTTTQIIADLKKLLDKGVLSTSEVDLLWETMSLIDELERLRPEIVSQAETIHKLKEILGDLS